MSHSQFNFKSSGFKNTDSRFKQNKTIEMPIGIKTPLQVGDDIFKMNYNPVLQITDNFRNLLMTNHGERLGRYNFGGNLKSLLFEYTNDPNFEGKISEIITEITQKHIPSIQITNIKIKETDINEKNIANKLGLSKIKLTIEYIIPIFKSGNQILELDFSVGGWY